MKTWKKVALGAAAGIVLGIALDREKHSRRVIDSTIDGSKRMFSSFTNKNEGREQGDRDNNNNDRRDNNHNDRRN